MMSLTEAVVGALKRGNFEAKDGDWEARNDALLECTRLFSETGERLGKGTTLPGEDYFDAGTWRALRLPVQACLKDLRSHLVREACGLIVAVASACNGEDGQPRCGASRDGGRMLLREVVPTLFELVSSGNKTNAKFVDDAIRGVLRHCRFKQLVGVAAEYSSAQHKGKSAHVREACARYAAELATVWGSAWFKRHDDSLELLEKSVKLLLRDPSAEARAAARDAYRAYAAEFPERKDALLADLDDRLRARLVAAKPDHDAGVATAKKRTFPDQCQHQFRAGDRVRVQRAKTATVRFVGETSFSTGLWVGVELDASDGKHDGLVAGRRYFDAPPHRGLFVRPAQCSLLGDDDTAEVATASKLACEHKRFLGDLLDLLQRQLADLAKFEGLDLSRTTAADFSATARRAPHDIRRILDTHVSRLRAVPEHEIPAPAPPSSG
ncbi:hypothetical protein CTAYLR_000451 [Chrysophaeum taylorii]|uniref:CAP-Gly domain-containing protein n=1 Tax=Chrysophaeum taylorii TaxID=2483200 RepID=A0AAD7UGV5_9STRA|nr:hypothetical protein CTAYLR_000451 [Chrysophaeum taylorii]